MKNKNVTIYKSESLYIIHSDSYTTAGVLLASEPYFKLDIPVMPFELVSHIKKALQAATENVPHPTNWDGQASQYAQAIGCSMKRLHKEFKYCSVEETNTSIIIAPSENKGPKNGWFPLKGKEIEIPKNSDDETFFRAIEAAFAACEVW